MRTTSVLSAAVLLASILLMHAVGEDRRPAKTPASSRPANAHHDDGASAAAFQAIVPVLHHPRCMNCHSAGDYPRQGDDGHRHTMDVQRGPDGHGVNAVECSTCHQDHNLAGLHTPPGAPEWGLPPPSTPMVWEGLSDHQLCELFKDPAQNGHRTVAQIVDHMHARLGGLAQVGVPDRTVAQIVDHMHSPLVLWGWNPGEGRTPVPIPQQQFLALVSRWASLGASCP